MSASCQKRTFGSQSGWSKNNQLGRSHQLHLPKLVRGVKFADYIEVKTRSAAKITRGQEKIVPANGRLKIIGSGSLVIVLALGISYYVERPKYRFEQMAAEVGEGMPGARLISSFKSANLASPVSWFWPATTTWDFALPDPQLLDRFYTYTLFYGQVEPDILLVDVYCEDQTVDIYSLDQPESASPALDPSGAPVTAPSGDTYRLFDTRLVPPATWLPAFCDTDWTTERNAVRTEALQ